MDNKIRIGDYITVISWDDPNTCKWKRDFGKSFKVVGFAKDFTSQGFPNHWKEVTEKYEFVDLDQANSVSMDDFPHLILSESLSNDVKILHPIFVKKDYGKSRGSKIDEIIK